MDGDHRFAWSLHDHDDDHDFHDIHFHDIHFHDDDYLDDDYYLHDYYLHDYYLHDDDVAPLMICGAWVGEFGWELFCWQAQLRAKKERGRIDEMVSITRPGHDLLYKDFSRVEHFTPTGRSNEFRNEGQDPDLLPPTDFPPRDLSGAPGKFIKFGSRTPGKGFDVLIHARNRRLRSEDNWNPENWTAVLWDLAGMSAASVGTFAESIHVPGTTDRRGLDLADLADVMASSKVILGTASGAIHFATLCGLPQVVWTNRQRGIDRFSSLWNPFEVKVETIKEQDPSPSSVLERLRKGNFLAKESRSK